MNKIIHKADSRGFADHGWLKSHHTFSFADYYRPDRTRFGVLRVLNDDVIEPGMGFGTHPHDNMEIVTIPLEGEIAHKDSTGTKEVIRPNEVQIMSAGSGLTHSEFNNSNSQNVSLLQIWVFPKVKNINPRYDQKIFSPDDLKNKIKTVVSPDKDSDTLWINQDSYFNLSNLEAGNEVNFKLKINDNGVYIFLIEGEIEVAGETLNARDALGLEDFESIDIKAVRDSKVLLIEVPMN